VSRKYRPPEKRGAYGRPEAACEHVGSDRDDRGLRSSVTLHGAAIGRTPEGLLEYALELLDERDEKIEKLLRHVPRRFEDRVKALSGPAYEARQAIVAVELLLGNLRLVIDEPPYEDEDAS
jgi:hypothetical protein